MVDCFKAALSGGLQGLEAFRCEVTTATEPMVMDDEEEVVESPAVPRVQEEIAIDSSPPVAVVAPDDGIPSYLKNVQLSFRNKSRGTYVMEWAYNEFYGLGNMADKLPIDGGFYGLEKTYKAKWRSGYSTADGVFFSAVKRTFQGLHNKAGIDRDAGVGDWNQVAVVVGKADHEYLCAKGWEQFARKLRDGGWLVKKTRAKRKRGEETSVVA